MIPLTTRLFSHWSIPLKCSAYGYRKPRSGSGSGSMKMDPNPCLSSKKQYIVEGNGGGREEPPGHVQPLQHATGGTQTQVAKLKG